MAASLHALIEQSIDYAGMFPPCSLDLDPALKNQSSYVVSPEAWMLGAFILPVAQFDAATQSLSQFDRKHPLRVSALGPKTETTDSFHTAFKETLEAIRQFSAEHADRVAINQLEMPIPADVDLNLLGEARAALGQMQLNVFWETPVDTAERTIALLAKHESEKHARPFGYKLRTGGVTEDAFPTSAQVATALVLATRQHVRMKFTAGLHHPICQFRDEVKTKMHGFLNVLGAAVLAAEHSWDEGQTSAMLDDENPKSFSFDDILFAWRDWEIATDRIKARRKFVTSFGSCSFDEPREDLRALELL
ncbi:MAG: hypothetical protein ABI925_06140 [Verrucomicrobiota bacterium]